ncbi:DUF1800 domain-containing protein [Hyphomonadaceae bacterium ML37]|nr:DUF1800 domain-containing protein [Hyphomonadaceae bacterium ML37]
MSARDAAIAVNRFGLGARPGDIGTAARDPHAWLAAQIDPSVIAGPAPGMTAREGLVYLQTEYPRFRAEIERAGADPEEIQRQVRELLREPRLAHIAWRTGIAVTTPDGFAERWVRFWSNHFSVSSNTLPMAVVAPTLEAEAIRPNAFGPFADLLRAAELHPAMLIYLDQALSLGPNSMAGRFLDRGINENLAREILELHTLGVAGGYGQGDVEALARILTGWTVGSRRLRSDPEDYGRAVFDVRLQEPGAHTLLGQSFGGEGPQRAGEALEFIAARPRTARFLSEKLARHFLSDDPAPRDIAHIEAAWTRSGGDLAAVARAVITAPSAFDPALLKFKTPEEFLISSLRAVGAPAPNPRQLYAGYVALGQAPFSAPSPAGWPDQAEAWASPDAVLKRLDFATAVAARVGRNARPRERAVEVLGPSLSDATAQAIARAETPEQGLTLLLMSPEFQRR